MSYSVETVEVGSVITLARVELGDHGTRIFIEHARADESGNQYRWRCELTKGAAVELYQSLLKTRGPGIANGEEYCAAQECAKIAEKLTTMARERERERKLLDAARRAHGILGDEFRAKAHGEEAWVGLDDALNAYEKDPCPR